MNDIKPVNVSEETKDFITVEYLGGYAKPFYRRTKKITDFSSYFKTWEEAQNHLSLKVRNQIRALEEQIILRNRELQKVLALKKP